MTYQWIKHNSILLISFILLSCSSSINLNREEMYFINENTELTWFGVDFSRVKLIDQSGFTDPQQIRDQYFNSINLVVINEPKKYNLESIFNNKNIKSDLSIVKNRNLMPIVEELVIDITEKDLLISDGDIPSIVNEYNIDDDKIGIGIVFIMQSLIKTHNNKMGNMYVTFFDIKTKNILLTKLMSGEPGGFGFRNYWVRTVKNVLNQIKY